MTTATLVSNVAFVFFLVCYFASREFKKGTHKVLSKFSVHILTFLSLSAVVGSLVYSNVIGFPPCDLCWIQRIFMYPIPLLGLTSLFRNYKEKNKEKNQEKNKEALYFSIPLAVLGGMVALYHSYTNLGGGSLLPCTAEGGACSKLYVLEYGYITIPFMALSLFVYILTIAIISLRKSS